MGQRKELALLDSENQENNSKKAIAKEAEKLAKKIQKLKLELKGKTSPDKQEKKIESN